MSQANVGLVHLTTYTRVSYHKRERGIRVTSGYLVKIRVFKTFINGYLVYENERDYKSNINKNIVYIRMRGFFGSSFCCQ